MSSEPPFRGCRKSPLVAGVFALIDAPRTVG